MARDFKGPLTKDDLAWLKARFSTAYVARMIELHGVKGGKTEPEAPEEPENGPETGEDTEGEGDAPETTEEAGDGPEEDLIGDVETFDVLGSTESEVKGWVETASDEAKAEALATEQGREDREPRKGVVSLLS